MQIYLYLFSRLQNDFMYFHSQISYFECLHSRSSLCLYRWHFAGAAASWSPDQGSQWNVPPPPPQSQGKETHSGRRLSRWLSSLRGCKNPSYLSISCSAISFLRGPERKLLHEKVSGSAHARYQSPVWTRPMNFISSFVLVAIDTAVSH